MSSLVVWHLLTKSSRATMASLEARPTALKPPAAFSALKASVKGWVFALRRATKTSSACLMYCVRSALLYSPFLEAVGVGETAALAGIAIFAGVGFMAAAAGALGLKMRK